MTMTAHVQKQIDRAVGKVAQIIRRTIVKTVKASGIGQVEGFDGEAFDNTEFWQQYGFACRPPSGTEAITLLVDAEGEKAVVVSTHNRSDRPSGLSVGDSVLFGKQASDGTQAKAHAKADGDLDLVPGTGQHATLGGASSAGEAVILGDTFNTSHAALLSAVQALGVAIALDSALAAGTKTAGTTLSTAVSTFSGLQATWLATKGKAV